MTRAAAEDALNRAKSALSEARRELPKDARRNPEATVKWRVEQAQRHVQEAVNAYYPEVKPETEE